MAGIPKLIVLSAQLRGQKFELEGKDEFAMGRTDQADFCIPDPTISGHHCSVMVMPDGTFAVRDEGSTNGTRLNNEKMSQGQELPLKNGDILQAGGVEMLFDNESSRSEGGTTQTVISLKDSDTSEVATQEMVNLGGDMQQKKNSLRQEPGRSMMAVWAGLGALGFVALVLFVWMLVKTLKP